MRPADLQEERNSCLFRELRRSLKAATQSIPAAAATEMTLGRYLALASSMPCLQDSPSLA